MATELTITVDVLGGCTIEDAVEQAISLARKLGVGVDFNFNGHNIWVFKTSVPEEKVKEYLEAIKKH